MTIAERKLWSRIRGKQLEGFQFYRQKILGNYIVDFYCHKAKLVIELDGGQHYSEEGRRKDIVRDEFLRGLGLSTIRFSDREIFENLDGVIETIMQRLKSHQTEMHHDEGTEDHDCKF
jgi:very-short-patch-repair endonuclease